MREILGYVVLLVIVAIGFQVIWVFIRFGVITPKAARGAKGRLRKPDIAGIESLCEFSPPQELLEFYRKAAFIDSTEFYLVDHSRTPPKAWFIGGFNPLTLADVREAKLASGVSGIPIADDMDKGQYFIAENGAVVLDSPNISGRRVEVAANIEIFRSFESRREWKNEV